jgi:hypothetical protein
MLMEVVELPNKTTPGFDAQEYMRGYMREYRKNKRIARKEVSFAIPNEADEELLEWLEAQPEGFATYIKRLIREDMERRKNSP